MQTLILACALILGGCFSLPTRVPSKQADEERDFVPGEKVIFYDDFTDMAKGAAPSH